MEQKTDQGYSTTWDGRTLLSQSPVTATEDGDTRGTPEPVRTGREEVKSAK